MNQKFCFQRFWTYFKYDVVQMWRNHGKAALILGGAGVLLYVVHVLGSLVFPDHVWLAPGLEARKACHGLAWMLFIFFQARTYGFLTEKRAGSAWLMLPASAAEKTLSMLLMTVLVLPVAFEFVYLGSDALLCLLDPTASGTLLPYSLYPAEVMDEIQGSVVLPFFIWGILCNAVSMTYFLLSGLLFKKWKIVGGISVLLGLMILLTFLLVALSESHFIHIEFNGDTTEWEVSRILWIASAVTALVWAGLAWGVYRRVKTIKH